MEKLYNRFLSEMDQPLSSRYYEEDELLDIFDYATDIADDAVRMEVVLLAQRLCPGSVELAQRKAMLYWSMGNDKAATKVMGMIPGKHFMAQLTRLRIIHGKNNIPDSGFTNLIKRIKPESLPDEEVIQLIEAVEDSGKQQWLVDNYDRLKVLAQYPETLIYNLVDPILDWGEDKDFTFVNRLLDDLTMSSPYDIGYWVFAADVAIVRQEDPERALGFVEYALAINPKSIKALIIKTGCLLSLPQPDYEGAVKAAKNAYLIDSDSLLVCKNYAHALLADGRNEECLQVIKRYLGKPGCELNAVLPVAMSMDGLDIYSLLKSAVDNVAVEEREHQLDNLLAKLVEHGSYEYAAQTMNVITECGFQENYSSDFIIELYFRTNRFELAFPFVVDLLQGSQPLSNRTWLLVLLMQLPVPDKDYVLDMIDERIASLNSVIERGSLGEILEAKAIKAYALMVRHNLETGQEFHLEDYAPFCAEIPLKL